MSLSRALNYPYPVAPWPDFLFVSGQARPWDPAQRSIVDLEARVPVLAVGSNRSPEQLLRKYGVSEQAVAVSSITLTDYDVAYSSYLTYYGSVPATLVAAPGHRCQLYLTWLTASQLVDMHATESVGRNTQYGCLPAPPGGWYSAGRRLDRVWTYASMLGLMPLTTQPTLLAAIDGQNRRWRVAGQREVLVWVHENWADQSFDAWLATIIRDEKQRQQINQAMAPSALAWTLPDFVAE